ncbi:Hypothetical_protein [Hexamita inflata]|uniref:Hypothetical_protein n=1 Tax=Hexamita inflata TaxID=28002 RepID=A0AA86R3Y5_9EUKA|nr:Hypothetical protein HINF_LOCUS53064 [Hexamita inflata]
MRQVMNECSQAEHPRSTKSTKPPTKHQLNQDTNTNQKPIGHKCHKSPKDQGRPTLSNSNSTVTEMIDFNYVTQLHKQAQKGALTKHEELNTAGTNQRRPSEVFKLIQHLTKLTKLTLESCALRDIQAQAILQI